MKIGGPAFQNPEAAEKMRLGVLLSPGWSGRVTHESVDAL